MTRKFPLSRALTVDTMLLAIFLAPAAWIATHTQRDLEAALGLHRAHWVAATACEQEMITRLVSAQMAHNSTPVRDRYAERYPRSPLNVLNQIRAKHVVWDLCSSFQQRALPAFFVASIGLGWIAIQERGE